MYYTAIDSIGILYLIDIVVLDIFWTKLIADCLIFFITWIKFPYHIYSR